MPRHKHRVLHRWMLVATGACTEQVDRFREVFGYRCAINKKNLLKARKEGLWVFWFMEHFVGHENDDEFRAFIADNYPLGISTDRYGDESVAKIIDKFLELFENNRNEYWWSEHPFDI